MKLMCVITGMRSGGAERVLSTICNELSKRNEVCLTVLKDRSTDYYLESRILFVAGNIMDRSFIKSVLFVRKQIDIWKPDVVLSFMTKSNIISVISSRMSKCKPPVIIAERANPYYAGNIYKFIRRFVYPLADGCVFQTRQAQDYYKSILKCESAVIRNPLNPDFELQPYNGERNKRIVTVGRLSKEKNQKLLIDAFARIAGQYPGYILEIYGDGPLKEELDSYITELDLRDRVQLMGRKDNIQNYIKDAAVFVLPSDSEGMPNALIEAMAIGLPSIATDCPIGGPAAIIRHGENGLLLPMNDAEKIADAIRRILDDKQFADHLSINARHIINDFAADNVCAEWEHYIQRVMGDRGK